MIFPSVLPLPDRLDPRTIPVLRWGIIGPGWIAERFVQSVQEFSRQQILGIESREHERAKAFAERFQIPHAFQGDMIESNAIDAIYIATPHPFHFDMAKRAILAGKPVLVEKPICVNAEEAAQLVALAREKNVFLMEAYWTDFLPKFSVLRKILQDGIIGDLTTVLADLGEYFTSDHRIMRSDMAGGPMLDLGTYVTGLATGVLGRPDNVCAFTTPAPSGVDGQTAMIFDYASGAQAVLHTSILAHTSCAATISGTKGIITIPYKFFTPGPFTVAANDLDLSLTWDEPRSFYDGLYYQVDHMAWCIGQGLKESPVRSHQRVLLNMATMDRARDAGRINRPR